jgi:cell division protein FtsB
MAERKKKSPYIYGNTARSLQEELNASRKILLNETRKNREKAHHMNIGYILFLSGALFACAIFLIGYVQKQSELTSKIAQVSKLEKELNTLKLSNDEMYTRIQSNVNLEEIRKIAIDELGMTYAEEGQVILYQGNKKDYMHQNAEE